jgi:RHS repeat-associated protein
VYNYTDHLGNIRVSYTLNPADGQLKILEENHYYPFGLKHSNYNVDKADFDKDETGIFAVLKPVERSEFQYKYNGKEFQDELGLNWDSFKWRNYDYAIGRFMSIDPLTEEYHTWSPYVFSGNRVIDARELEGLEPHSVHKSLEDAGENFGNQYNGLSIRSNGEIGTKFYKGKMNDETYYSYTVPTWAGENSGAVDPSTAENIPGNTTLVGKGHTHAAAPKGKLMIGGIWYGGYADKPSSEDVDQSIKDAKANSQYEFDIVITPNGSMFIYGPTTNEDRAKPANINMPSDPNTRKEDRKNNISPNTTPEVLPNTMDEDNFPKIRNN